MDPNDLPARFQYLSILGRGGMGTVVLARDLELGREVAVKVVHTEIVGLESREPRFWREARIQAGLEHRNVVGIFDAFQEEGRAFLVMEVIEGDIRIYPEAHTDGFATLGGDKSTSGSARNRDLYESIDEEQWPEMENHSENFVTCVRSRKRCNADLSSAWEEMVTNALAIESWRHHVPYRYDALARDVVAV